MTQTVLKIQISFGISMIFLRKLIIYGQWGCRKIIFIFNNIGGEHCSPSTLCRKNIFWMSFDFMVDKLIFGAIIFAVLEIRRRNIWTVVIIEVALAMGKVWKSKCLYDFALIYFQPFRRLRMSQLLLWLCIFARWIFYAHFWGNGGWNGIGFKSK